MLDPTTLAGPLAGQAIGAGRTASAPIVQVRAVGKESTKASADRLTSACNIYFLSPNTMTRVAMEDALDAVQQCCSQPVRTGAAALVDFLFELRDPVFVPCEQENHLAATDDPQQDAIDFWYFARQRRGEVLEKHEKLYRGEKAKFNALVHEELSRGLLTTAKLATAAWLGGDGRLPRLARRVLRRRTPALPTAD